MSWQFRRRQQTVALRQNLAWRPSRAVSALTSRCRSLRLATKVGGSLSVIAAGGIFAGHHRRIANTLAAVLDEANGTDAALFWRWRSASRSCGHRRRAQPAPPWRAR
jgi:hypothetical protein